MVKPRVVICPTKDCHLVKMKNSKVNIKLKRYLKQMYLPVTVAYRRAALGRHLSAIFLFFFHFFSACFSLNFKLWKTYILLNVSAKAYIYLLLQHKHMGFGLHLHTLIVPSHGFHVLLRGGYNRLVTLISNDLLKWNNSALSFGA